MSCISDQRQYSSLRTLPCEESFPELPDDGSSVWVGFIEHVPVIGTVREGVEWVLAVHQGDPSVIKQKEEAIKKSLCDLPQKSLQDAMMRQEAAAATGGHVGSDGLQDIREINLDFVIEYVKHTGEKTKNKQTPQQRKALEERLMKKINEEVLKNIKCIKPDYELTQPLKEEHKRSKRGEHVFNNDILKFHKKLLNDFLQDIQKRFKLTDDDNNTLGSHGLDDNTVCEISDKMVVHFDEEEFYVNSNTIVYGVYCSELRLALCDILNYIYPKDVPDSNTMCANNVIFHMNDKQVYVDPFAKKKWIEQDRSGLRLQKRFDSVKCNVADMYQNKRGVKWCSDIMNKLKIIA